MFARWNDDESTDLKQLTKTVSLTAEQLWMVAISRIDSDGLLSMLYCVYGDPDMATTPLTESRGTRDVVR